MRIGFLVLGGIGLAMGLRRMTNAAEDASGIRHSMKLYLLIKCSHAQYASQLTGLMFPCIHP